LDVDVEKLAKGKRLGVAQLREISRDILNRAMALAQLDGERSPTDVADGGRVAVLRERVGEGLRANARIGPCVADDRGVPTLDLARTCCRERFNCLFSPELPKIPQRLGSEIGVAVGQVNVRTLCRHVVTGRSPTPALRGGTGFVLGDLLGLEQQRDVAPNGSGRQP
jgi:hypothetical protein